MQGRVGAPPLTHFRGGAAIASRRNAAGAAESWVAGGASLVSSNSAIFCSPSADAFSNQKRPAAAAQQQRVGTERPFRPLRPFEEPVGSLVVGAFGFQLEQLPERARGPIPRAELVIQG
jgi:hypothetical protein